VYFSLLCATITLDQVTRGMLHVVIVFSIAALVVAS
jgi:hypothetical protein